jgi:hypothetical protein
LGFCPTAKIGKLSNFSLSLAKKNLDVAMKKHGKVPYGFNVTRKIIFFLYLKLPPGTLVGFDLSTLLGSWGRQYQYLDHAARAKF